MYMQTSDKPRAVKQTSQLSKLLENPSVSWQHVPLHLIDFAEGVHDAPWFYTVFLWACPC